LDAAGAIVDPEPVVRRWLSPPATNVLRQKKTRGLL